MKSLKDILPNGLASGAADPQEGGFMTVAVTVILAVLLLAGLSMLGYVTSTKRVEKMVRGEMFAVQVAEAGIQKAIYCLNATNGTNCGGTYGLNYIGETGVDIGTGTFTTTLSGAGSEREVTSTGTTADGVSEIVRATLTTIPPMDDMSFGYALQAGDGGAYLENNSLIRGTLYANGDVACQSKQGVVDGDIYVSLANGKIDACTANFHAHADRILNSKVKGDAYYYADPAGISGTSVNGTKYPYSATPDREDLPSVNLDFWRESAEEGGVIYGNYSPADNSSLGPVKIVGNLIMNNNVDVTITGPVWVVGNITTGNNCSFTLHSNFGQYSTVILADDQSNPSVNGKITISNNTGIYGSGNPKSHILFISTNSSINPSSPALSVANNATGAIFYATDGVLRIQNNAGAKSLAAYKLYVSQNATVNYVESELADTKFSNSPGATWRQKEEMWRQVK